MLSLQVESCTTRTYGKMLATRLFGDNFAVASDALGVTEPATGAARSDQSGPLDRRGAWHGVGQKTDAPGRPTPRVGAAVNHRAVTALKLLEMRAVR